MTNASDLLKEMILLSLDNGKDYSSRYNALPDLALSSSFILYTLHRPLPLLHTQCQSPQPICQTFQWAPPVSCQPLGMGWFPCKNLQGQWLYYLVLHPSLKSTHYVTPGQCRILAKQLVGWGGCWEHRLSSAVRSSHSLNALQCSLLDICTAVWTAEAGCVVAPQSFSTTFSFAATGRFLIYTLVQ